MALLKADQHRFVNVNTYYVNAEEN